MNSLKAKTYYFYKGKSLYGSMRYKRVNTLRIECVGGESMTEENEIVFLNPEDIPRLLRGKQGKDWSEVFDKIPVNKVMMMETEDYGSAPNIRAQVAIYNKDKKKTVLKATQRTNKETEKVTVYVSRVA